MQSMWGDSICDPNCNNLACNHDDCTSPQIIEKCVTEQDVSGVGFSDPPLAAGEYKFPYNEQLVPMNMQLDIKPARLEIRMDINEMVLQQELAFVFQWQDKNMQDSPCKAVLTELLSLNREEGKSDLQRNAKSAYQRRFWLPKVNANNLIPGYFAFIDEATFTLDDAGEWAMGLTPPINSEYDPEEAKGNATSARRLEAEQVTTEHLRRCVALEEMQVGRLLAHDHKLASEAGDATDLTGAAAARAYETLRKRRHDARMEGGGWHAAERRRMQTAVEGEEVAGIPCLSCPMLAGEIEFQILEGFTYDDFPFDRHTIFAEFVVKGADLFTCKGRDGLAIMGLTDANAQLKLLPTTATWVLDGTLNETVSLQHPIDPFTGEMLRSTCRIEIHIRRNWGVYFIKQICTMLLCTAGGLSALMMQPGELLGDRCALIVVAVLITLTAIQMDIGLGNLSYLIWVDWFNLLQLIVLLFALMQTMVLHRLEHAKCSDLVIVFDKVFRVFIPFCLYPCSTTGMILIGLHYHAIGYILIAFGFLGTGIVGTWWANKLLKAADVAQGKAVLQARQMHDGMADEEYFACIESLFTTFDLDCGGELDVRETRNLFNKMFPDAPRTLVGDAMMEVNKYIGGDETLDEASFILAYAEAIKVFKADPDYGYRVEEYAVEAAGRKPAIALPSWLSSKKMEVGKKASAASSSVRLRKSPASQPPPPPEDLSLDTLATKPTVKNSSGAGKAVASAQEQLSGLFGGKKSGETAEDEDEAGSSERRTEKVLHSV